MTRRKAVEFCGATEATVAGFPAEAKEELGYALWEVEQGFQPSMKFKHMADVGPGVMELISEDVGAQKRDFRVIYVAKFEDAIWVLHAFEKKTQRTPPPVLDLARKRYSELAQRTKKQKAKHK